MMRCLLYTNGQWTEIDPEDYEDWLDLIDAKPWAMESRGVRLVMIDSQ